MPSSSDLRRFWLLGQLGLSSSSLSTSDLETLLHTNGGRAETARAVLAEIGDSGPHSINEVSPLAPTITLSAAGAATSIASGVLIAPKRKSTLLIDTQNDPSFEYVGVRPNKLAVSSTDLSYADFLTGGSSQARRDAWRPRFNFVGQVFEARFRMRGTSFNYRIWVNGKPLSLAYTTLAVTTSQRYFLKVDFGSVVQVDIELDVNDIEFGGIVIGPTDTLTKPTMSRRVFMGFGDSITSGALGIAPGDCWPTWAARTLNMAWNNTGIGGSGYLSNIANGSEFNKRLAPDIVSQPPDVLVVFGGFNDVSGNTPAVIKAQVTSDLQYLKDNLPTTCIVVIGNWVRSNNDIASASMIDTDNAIKDAAISVGVPFFSLYDPENLRSTTNPWTATTLYQVGDVVIESNVIYKCITQHTSTASFDATKFKQVAFVTGTGRSGTPATNGNADIIVNTDGIHVTALGHKILGQHFASLVTRALKFYAGLSA